MYMYISNTLTIKMTEQKLTDETIKSFVQNKETDTIGSHEEFEDWKDEFLKTFRQYLNPIGTATAREVDEELYLELENLAKACLETKKLVKEGKITPDYCSVSGQRCINEMITMVKNCEASIEAYVPKTKALDKKCGYTKFELAAVLVRDGFRAYGLMTATRDYLVSLVNEGGALSEVLKPNQLTIAMYYFLRLEAFQEFMADLGMYQMMEQCVEIYKIRPRNKKKNKFNRNGRKDALDVSTDDERAARKVQPPPSPPVVPEPEPESEPEEEGPMFQNKHKDGPKVRAIIDNGWSVGFMPGEEIKAPNGKSKKENRKKKKKKMSSQNRSGDEEYGDNGTDKNNKNNKNNNNNNNNKSSKSKGKDDDDHTNQTDTTDDEDEDEDEGSSSEEEDDEEEDEDYIYYFDPVQGIVGKISRASCLKERLIVSAADRKGKKETYDGLVEHWDPKKSDDAGGGGEMMPGKMELIGTMKEVLRGRAGQKPRSGV